MKNNMLMFVFTGKILRLFFIVSASEGLCCIFYNNSTIPRLSYSLLTFLIKALNAPLKGLTVTIKSFIGTLKRFTVALNGLIGALKGLTVVVKGLTVAASALIVALKGLTAPVKG